MTKFIVPIISALMITFTLPACAWPVTYSAEPIEAWLVDEETKEPIEGAIIVAHWVLEGGIHVDRVGELVILEAVSDKNGRFHFPGWGPIRHWKSSRLTNYDPEILIFKSGYKYQRLFNEATKEAITGKPFPIRKSRWSGKTIALERFEGPLKEYVAHFEKFNNELEHIAVDDPQECNWKKISRAISTMRDERLLLEGRGIDPHTLSSIDKRLFANDKYFAERGGVGCGSPTEFFRNYQQ